MTSFPLPVSPVIRTATLLLAIFLTDCMSCCIGWPQTTAVIPRNECKFIDSSLDAIRFFASDSRCIFEPSRLPVVSDEHILYLQSYVGRRSTSRGAVTIEVPA